MAYQVYDGYYPPNYYNAHDLSPPEEFFPDQPRYQPGRHASHGSFGHSDGNDYPYHHPQYDVTRAAVKYQVNYHPTTVSAQAIEDNRASYSPHSSPSSRHSEHRPSSPAARPSKPTPADERVYCLHPSCLDSRGNPTKSFSRRADVARHRRSAHERRYIDCPFKKCVRKGDQGFTRSDHLVEHRRGFHMEPIPKKGGASGGKAEGSGRKGRHDV